MCVVSIHYLVTFFPDFKVFFSLWNFLNYWVVNDDVFIDFECVQQMHNLFLNAL